jgi:deoxyribodipyrimidine photo-lyase
MPSKKNRDRELKTVGVHVFTRDLRVKDNAALNHNIACSGGNVVPLFVCTPEQLDAAKSEYYSANAARFMFECLENLRDETGGKLVVASGTHQDVLRAVITDLAKRYDVINITLARDYTPYSRKRLESINKIMRAANKKVDGSVRVVEVEDYTLFPLGSVVTGSREAGGYRVFTPFYTKVKPRFGEIRKPTTKKASWVSARVSGGGAAELTLGEARARFVREADLAPAPAMVGGRPEALKKLRAPAMKKLADYGKTRNTLSIPTSRLSAYIKFGCVSIREVFFSMYAAFRDRNHDLIRQLLWREFYAHLVHWYPQVIRGVMLNDKYNRIQWNGTRTQFNKWREGRTGYPIVDACMRELNNTGYMHNRGRLITSEFLTKILRVNWRWGERYFAQRLIDYDPASNNGGWTWVSGVGTDSQPYFRIMNPWGQGKKHDPDGAYIRAHLPEVVDVPVSYLHKWDEHHKQCKEVAPDYPAPMVVYEKERETTLKLYKKYV